MAVASFHPSTGESYFMAEVPVWEREVESIFEEISAGREEEEEEVLEMSPPRTRPQSQPQSMTTKVPMGSIDDQYDIPF